MLSHYELLGLDRGATTDEITAQWRIVARQLHPDKGGSAEEFAIASIAASILRNPTARAKYNLQLDLLTEPCSRCGGEGRVWKQSGFNNRIPFTCVDCNGTGRTQ